MELERQPSESNRTRQTPQAPFPTYSNAYEAAPGIDPILEPKRNFCREVCVTLGVCLLTIGLVGFVMDNFLGAHLSYAHNFVHLIPGALAVWFGVEGLSKAKTFSIVFGIFYTALGIAGFALGQQGLPTIGSIHEDAFLWKVIPQVLELGMTDHIIHVLVGAAFLFGITTWKTSSTAPPRRDIIN
ncbi:MAG: hypothetical protein AAGB31_15100 [Bdellovibrio sp.]